MSGSLSGIATFVPNALRIAPAVAFRPEAVRLGDHSFVGYARSGLAAALQPPEGDALRATVAVSVTVRDATGERVVGKTLTLRGPGDVLGLDPQQIIRRVPEDGCVDAEENFLAHVEFDRPELPWLFTPRPPAGGRLPPWIVLVVCDARAARLEPGPSGLPQRLRTLAGELQPLDDAWAFAHAQVAGQPPEGEIPDRLSDAHAPANLSRLICPRRLAAGRSWIACVVPAFDCGARAGLGLPGGSLGPAWTRAADGTDANAEILLPAYHAWRFATGEAGDFEQLAKRIHGVPAPWKVGRRLLDAAEPGGGLAPLADGAPGDVQVLRCALVSPAPPPDDVPAEGAAWDAAARDALRGRLDAEAGGDPDLPLVGPRLYARFQRGAPRLGPVFGAPPGDTAAADADWFAQLNTTPVHRIIAGLGTRVVRRDQEALMEAAWLQVGALRQANARITRMQFGRFVAGAVHRRHVAKLPLGDLAQVLRGVQGQIRVAAGPLTVHGMLEGSATPPAAMTAAFRRAVRLGGPLVRQPSQLGAARAMVAEAGALRDMRVARAPLDGVGGLSRAAIEALPRETLRRAFRVGSDAQLAPALDRLVAGTARPGVVDRLQSPAAGWAVPQGGLDLRMQAAERIAALVEQAMPRDATVEPARVESLAPILSGIAAAGIGAVSVRATVVLRGLEARVPLMVSPQRRDELRIERAPASVPQTRPGDLGGAPLGTPGGIRVPPVGGGLGGRLDERLMLRRGAAVAPGPSLATTRSGSAFAAPAPAAAQLSLSATGRLRREALVGGLDLGGAVVAERAPPAPEAAATIRLPLAERFDTRASRQVEAVLAERAPAPFRQIADAVSALAQGGGIGVLATLPDRAPAALDRGALLDAVAPARTATAALLGRLTLRPGALPAGWFDDGMLNPIMAAPRFDRPMYQALEAYDRDWLVPGLGALAETDFVTLLTTNPAFTEAFLLGLSDEMGRELLWRGYPTDQRGTYFRRFWDGGQDELKAEIHRFGATPLGSHLAAEDAKAIVVLAIRAELVRRFPDVLALAIEAQPAPDAAGRPVLGAPPGPGQKGRVVFQAPLPPDLLLVGFDLTVEEITAPASRWWFVLAEPPTGPRFGLDLPPEDAPAPGRRTPPPRNMNALSWGALPMAAAGPFLAAGAPGAVAGLANPGGAPASLAWGADAASTARILLQSPVRAAFDARKLLAPARPE
ncbi:hypothetical protein HB662_27780 [Roseomonas frigidaquae]|uniref:Uncharacterized protein n=1 Tax=Falsiroseomonas frigidaquae TaxID=487318 RepID=A0ABX1F8E4_9PROT|nr:hypothetical protein [Falsiroseomonas frigidaquae]NKE48600.1 hypothetical protein [Falsiroseomonas frigidaquae]